MYDSLQSAPELTKAQIRDTTKQSVRDLVASNEGMRDWDSVEYTQNLLLHNNPDSYVHYQGDPASLAEALVFLQVQQTRQNITGGVLYHNLLYELSRLRFGSRNVVWEPFDGIDWLIKCRKSTNLIQAKTNFNACNKNQLDAIGRDFAAARKILNSGSQKKRVSSYLCYSIGTSKARTDKRGYVRVYGSSSLKMITGSRRACEVITETLSKSRSYIRYLESCSDHVAKNVEVRLKMLGVVKKGVIDFVRWKQLQTQISS